MLFQTQYNKNHLRQTIHEQFQRRNDGDGVLKLSNRDKHQSMNKVEYDLAFDRG